MVKQQLLAECPLQLAVREAAATTSTIASGSPTSLPVFLGQHPSFALSDDGNIDCKYCKQTFEKRGDLGMLQAEQLIISNATLIKKVARLSGRTTHVSCKFIRQCIPEAEKRRVKRTKRKKS